MHAAPSVSYPVGRSAFAGRLYALAALLGLAGVAAWVLQSDSASWRQALGLAAVVACAALAARHWLAAPVGVLRWDGADWQWEEGATRVTGHAELALDLQSRMLVRFHPGGGGGRWLWLERREPQSDWEALRRAVYSRASTPVPPAGQPPAAEQ